MEKIVVTGGIGSGKSEACRLISRMLGNAPVYDADSRAKSLYDSNPSVVMTLEEEFGVALRDGDGAFVPKALAEVIFKDGAKLERVESLLFPLLVEDFDSFAAGCSGKYVIFESATILQKSFFDGFPDYLLLVDAPVSMRLSRACARDNVPEEKILARMAAQTLLNDFSHTLEADGDVADRRIDAVICNTGSVEDLRKRISETLEKLNIKMKTDLAKILSVSGQSGLYLYLAQARNGAIVEALSDKKRTTFGGKSRITTLADISIYTDDEEMRLKDVFLALKEVLGDEPAPSSKASADELKALFEKAVPAYDKDRFYVSHMKKVVDWYNCLRQYASFDFVEPEEEAQEDAPVQE